MSNLLAARWQMAISLGFHILFAVVGIALPLLMVMAETLWLRTGEPIYRNLAKRWARGAAILFAVGAVSGTVLSFELGLLWPRFMRFAGPVVGVGFGLEGFAFFTEAIFLGIYIYGWERVPRRAHLAAGAIVALSGALSGVLVVCVNAWMNTPAGFSLDRNGAATNIDPLAVLLNPSALSEALHMTIAAYAATGFAVAGVHAFYLFSGAARDFHERALRIALSMACVAALAQPISGDFTARTTARTQPLKLASLEGQFETERGAPLRIGGLPDMAARRTRFAIELPHMLSVLAYHDPNATVRGLNSFPRDEWPPVPVVHVAFQIMVACGGVMALASLCGAWTLFRKKPLVDRRLLVALVACSPLGMIAVLAGWVVTEVGRQPWIVRNLMRTADGLTTVGNLWASLAVYSSLYVLLGSIVIAMLRMQFRDVDPLHEPAEH
jgi:cytochrome d ubiquinol oxidase subunit I